MKTDTPASAHPQDVINVTAEQLPVYCPAPGTPLWSMHPKVYIDLGPTGRASCPYCGASYQLTGPAPAGH